MLSRNVVGDGPGSPWIPATPAHDSRDAPRRASPPHQVNESMFVTLGPATGRRRPHHDLRGVLRRSETLQATVCTPDTCVDISRLTNGASYSFKVRAVDAADAGPNWLASTSSHPSARSPSAPLSLTARTRQQGLGLVPSTRASSGGTEALGPRLHVTSRPQQSGPSASRLPPRMRP